MPIPGKRECFYILEMLESGLIDFTYTHPWAEQIITELDLAPSWLGDFATKKYLGHQTEALRSYIFAEPFEQAPEEMEKFHVACLWLRYERRELSWATFLRLAGEHLDAASADWDCEMPYHYLNLYEDANFSVESENHTREKYLAEHDLEQWIAMAREKYEPFKKIRRAKSANDVNTDGRASSGRFGMRAK